MLVETGGEAAYSRGRDNFKAAKGGEQDKTSAKSESSNRTRTRGSRESLERLKALVVNCGVFQSIIVPVRTVKPPDNAKKGSGKRRSLFFLRNSEGSLVGFEL